MINAFLMIWGIMLIGSIIVLLDWLGRRKERRERESHHPPTP